MQNVGNNSGPEKLEAVPEMVTERLALLKDVREGVDIADNEVQDSPMSHAEMTKKFWETHDMNNPEDVQKLAKFTLQFDVV